MCYIGKATKIFIFIVAVIAVAGLVIGFGIFGRNIHPRRHACSGENCSFSDYSSPPPFQIPAPSLPDPNASNPSDSTSGPPPPPPENEISLPSPPSPPLTDSPPPPMSILTPPPAVMAPPPQAFSQVPVSPGPMTSS